MPQILFISPLTAVVLFLAVFLSDSFLTVHAARLYHRGAHELIELEGSYELNPLFAKEIDRFRALSPRFLAMLSGYSLVICGLWYVSVGLSWLPQAYPFFIGAILLPQGAIHVRHIRNIAVFSQALRKDGIQGTIHYSRAFSFKLSTIEFVSFSALYLILAALSGNVLVLGGSLGSALLALRSFEGWRKTMARSQDR